MAQLNEILRVGGKLELQGQLSHYRTPTTLGWSDCSPKALCATAGGCPCPEMLRAGKEGGSLDHVSGDIWISV